MVDTDVEPEHARVYLNGELIGTADDFDGFPDYLYLERGRYTLEFRIPGYESGTLEVEARAGRFFPVDLKLKRVAGEAGAPWYERPQGLPVSRVYGPAQKGGPATVEARPDPALREELRARPGDDEDAEDAEDVENEAPTVGAGTSKSGAALDIRVSPSNASVYLDGEFFGTAEELGSLERGAAVSAGRHRIDVLAPGHAPRSLEFDLQAGERRQIVVELEGGLDKPNGGS
ncbi:MAG: PEGA domain-containing protein [Acidobacteria bacterium]|nr:PEGA domain-containing protein [Acidobacteriota bacterium]